MRIDCPTCQAAYDVPDAVIAAGRTLRCARCGADFAPVAAPAPEPALPPQASAPPPPAPPPDMSAAPAPHRAFVPPGEIERLVQAARQESTQRNPVLAVTAAWTLSFVVIGAMGWAAIAYRAPIAHAWPPATRVYAALGYAWR